MSAPPKFNFPGPVGTKRRRMRSGGNVATLNSQDNDGFDMSAPTSGFDGSILEDESDEVGLVTLAEADDVGEKVVQTSKCKGATTIPIFLKKTYKMIDTCDPAIASWTDEGDMFVVKDPDVFASKVIPQYFDHNKFSSFARQLNFYGFRKMQSKPIRNSDFDASAAKHVTFFNENFKRGRCDLLKKIQRSTRGNNASAGQDQAREIVALRDQVTQLESKIQEMTISTEERFRRLELDMLARIEQVMMAMQQQQQAQLRLQSAASIGTSNSQASPPAGGVGQQRQPWDSLQPPVLRNNAVASVGSTQAVGGIYSGQPQRQPITQATSQGSNGPIGMNGGGKGGGPTLPPHPKQKSLPTMVGLPGAMAAPPDRFNSLRDISALSRGISGVPRGTSVESSASAVLLRNSWEDKFFSMLMLDENGNANPANLAAAMAAQQQQGDNSGNMLAPSPWGLSFAGSLGNHNSLTQSAPPMVSEQSGQAQSQQQRNNSEPNPADDLSSVSSSDIP